MVKRAALVLLGALVLSPVFGTAALASTGGNRTGYPNTGAQIAIIAVVVVVILAGGILLWYFSHPRRRK